MKTLLGRLSWTGVVLWAVVSLTFALNELLPGDPARLVAGVQARPADVARIRSQLGLDRPLLVRYGLFWRRLVHLGPIATGESPHASCKTLFPLGPRAVHVDLGESFQRHQPVLDVLETRAPRTFALTTAALAIQLILGVAGGTLAAVHRGAWIDRLIVWASLVGVSAPTFVLALALQYILSRQLRLLPLDGYGISPLDHARSLILPALTLGIGGAAFYARWVRDEVVVLLRSDWARAARAKGLRESRVIYVHVLRNVLVVLATAAALDFGALMGGAVVTETVFRWPGIGELSLRATLDRDGPVLCGCVLVTALAVLFANAIVEASYGFLDPRINGPRAPGTR